MEELFKAIDQYGPVRALGVTMLGTVLLAFSVLSGVIIIMTWPLWLLVHIIHKRNQ